MSLTSLSVLKKLQNSSVIQFISATGAYQQFVTICHLMTLDWELFWRKHDYFLSQPAVKVAIEVKSNIIVNVRRMNTFYKISRFCVIVQYCEARSSHWKKSRRRFSWCVFVYIKPLEIEYTNLSTFSRMRKFFQSIERKTYHIWYENWFESVERK